jgi:hypothetical protein
VAGCDWDEEFVTKHSTVSLLAIPGHRPEMFDRLDDNVAANIFRRVWNISEHMLHTCDRIISNKTYIHELKVGSI